MLLRGSKLLVTDFLCAVFFVCVCCRQQCGFFRRSKYDDSVPSYNAVRIQKEEKDQLGSLEKKAWITSWSENESYS